MAEAIEKNKLDREYKGQGADVVPFMTIHMMYGKLLSACTLTEKMMF